MKSSFFFSLRRAGLSLLVCLLLVATFATPASSAQDVDLHELTWYVHVDLIDAGAGRSLAYWQGVIDDAVADANVLIQGGQGPSDNICCAELARTANVVTFGSPNDGYDVINTSGEQNNLQNFAGGSSSAFLVDSITWCGGSSPAAIGCAELPNCNGNGGDDPTLWMAVTVESFDDGTLPAVIAHERGHNACLNHVSNLACQVMQGTVFTPGNGGCFTNSECSNYRAGRTTTNSGLSCGCHASGGGGTSEADGLACPEVPGGICSGGICGVADGNAGVRLMAAAAPGTAGGGPPDDALAISGLSGAWVNRGQMSPTADDVRAMAASDYGEASTLYGVVPTTGDDRVVTLDIDTGAILSTIGTVSNGVSEIVAMAYHPGASPTTTDDRLIVLEFDGSNVFVKWLDPASPSSLNSYGRLLWSPAAAFTGLAYDSIQGKLFAATYFGPDGIFEIDLDSCPPSPCDSDQLLGADSPVDDASLSFSPRTGMLYLVGTSFGGARTFYDVIDPVTAQRVETLSLDLFTPAGLAAVPEPGFGLGALIGLLGLVIAGRRRGIELKL